MSEYILYGILFFVCTLIIQYITHKVRKNQNKGKNSFYTGVEVVIGLAIIGLIQGEIVFLAAIIGFIIADELGKSFDWH